MKIVPLSTIQAMPDKELKTLIDQLEQGIDHLILTKQDTKVKKANVFIGQIIDIYMERPNVELPNCLK